METGPVNLVCVKCGYDLRGTPGNRCSECGAPFGRVEDLISRIPWERDVHGVWRFPMTLFTLLFQNKLIRNEPQRTLDPARARRFGLIVRLGIIVPLVVLYSISHFFPENSPARICNQFTHGLFSRFWTDFPRSGVNPWEYVFHDYFLLMGAALNGVFGLLVGNFVLFMTIWDTLGVPRAVLGAGLKPQDKASRKNSIDSLGHYLSGIVGILTLLFLTLAMLNIYLIHKDKLSSFGEYWSDTIFFLVYTFLFPCIVYQILLTVLINRVHVYRIQIVGQARWIGTAARLLFGWLWRLIFWLFFVPCFIGLLRLVADSLFWTA